MSVQETSKPHLKVFISYSHHDKEFGQHLHARLLQDKLQLWMDWKDIPVTVEWWDKIQDGILACDNFLVIISPNSIASLVCNLEIAHAIALNKRIIPVLYESTNETEAFVKLFTKPIGDFEQSLLQDRDLLEIARDNWQVLTGINWIDFTDSATFEEKTKALFEALDTDFEYVNDHTRLLVRATDWMKRQYSPSLLLRGDDLIAAEMWLRGAGDRKPYPAPLHQEYLAKSRKVENQEKQRLLRLRQMSAVFGIMFLLATAASGLALVTTAKSLSIQATVEFAATFFALQQHRVATLASGGIYEPSAQGTLSPPEFIATLTQIAVLNAWEPVAQEMTGVEMVQVPAGCFIMGSESGPDERPTHEFCFHHPFWIDQYEVTNAEFEKVGIETQATEAWPEPNQPRTNVSWHEARDYCQSRGARLPTEAEWEYAARGPDSLVYPWGNNFQFGAVVAQLYGGGSMNVVGSKPRGTSWVGAFDMSGNAAEWVSSIYRLRGNNIFLYPYDESDGRENLEIADADLSFERVVRGGWDSVTDVSLLRGADRFHANPDWPNDHIGFRCALSA